MDAGFADRLREAMVRAGGLTQTQLAERVSVKQQSVSKWLAGNAPHPRTVELLAHRLGVRRDWLALGVGPIAIADINARTGETEDFLTPDEEETWLVERLRTVLNFGTVEEKQMVGRMLDAAAGAVESRMGGGPKGSGGTG